MAKLFFISFLILKVVAVALAWGPSESELWKVVEESSRHNTDRERWPSQPRNNYEENSLPGSEPTGSGSGPLGSGHPGSEPSGSGSGHPGSEPSGSGSGPSGSELEPPGPGSEPLTLEICKQAVKNVFNLVEIISSNIHDNKPVEPRQIQELRDEIGKTMGILQTFRRYYPWQGRESQKLMDSYRDIEKLKESLG